MVGSKVMVGVVGVMAVGAVVIAMVVGQRRCVHASEDVQVMVCTHKCPDAYMQVMTMTSTHHAHPLLTMDSHPMCMCPHHHHIHLCHRAIHTCL